MNGKIGALGAHRGNQFSGRDSSARGYREGKSRDARYIAQTSAAMPFAANSGYAVTEGSEFTDIPPRTLRRN